MSVHMITVTVEKDSIQVVPDTLNMTSQDEVQWGGTNARRFSIVFEGASPFDRTELSYSDATARQRPRAKGRFKYAVVSADDPGLRLDPVVVVGDPPTGEP